VAGVTAIATASGPPGPAGSGWHRRVWRLAGPIILSNVTIPLLGAVDTAVIGHLPDAFYLGAVAVGALIFNFLYWGFGFLRMGTTGFVAQAHGADDADEVRAALARAIAIAAGIAALVLVTQTLVIAMAMALIDASAEVEHHARAYFAIRVWGAPAALSNYVVLGWFLGMQNARAGLLLQVVINGVNIVLDLVFVVGLGMAVEGVALATLIAEYTGLALGAVMIHVALCRVGGEWRLSRILDTPRLRRMIGVNRDIFLRTLCLISALAYLTAQGAKMGDIVLAANAVMFNMVAFMSYALDGFAHAVEALTGRAVGARDLAAVRGAVRASSLWALAGAAGFSLAYAALGGTIIDALTDVAEVRSEAYAVLPWIIAAPVVAVWSYQFDGIFFGATRGPEMRNAMFLSLAVYLAAVEIFVPLWSNHGLWLAFLIFMATRGLTLAAYYPRIPRDIEARR
jgi:MATE family multidrug resistance protein